MALRFDRTIACAIATAAALAPGCALAIGGPQSARPARVVPVCDTGKGPVIADGLGATVGLLLAIAGGASDEGALAAVGGIAAVIYTISALAGNSRADACTEAMVAYHTEVSSDLDLDHTASAPGPRIHVPLDGETIRHPRGPAVLPPPPIVVDTTAATALDTTPPPPPTTPPPPKATPAKPAAPDSAWVDFWREVTP